MGSRKLTLKEGLFVAEYVIDENGSRAAIKAGFAVSGAAVTASRLLKKPHILAAIEEAHARHLRKLDITAEGVLAELRKQAYSDVGNLYDENGNPLPVHRLDPITRAAVIVEIESTLAADGKTLVTSQKVKMADKGQALDRLGRYHKLFTDKVQHSGVLTLEQMVCGQGGEDERV